MDQERAAQYAMCRKQQTQNLITTLLHPDFENHLDQISKQALKSCIQRLYTVYDDLEMIENMLTTAK